MARDEIRKVGKNHIGKGHEIPKKKKKKIPEIESAHDEKH